MEVELRQLQRRVGITTIFVTHDQEEALAISDRIAVMHGGEIVQLGTPESVYDWPRHPFVASFVGKANRLTGVVSTVDPTRITCDVAGGLRVRVATTRQPPPGSAIDIAIRPEKILVASGGSILENSVEGKVRTRIYLGMFTELRVTIASGAELVVICQNTRRATVTGDLGPGDPVVLSWSADACHVLE
jgi:ABC-type Fe3+/spermidine/putrescine transport system ATPase subunit